MASEKRREKGIPTVWKKRICMTVKRIKGKACRRVKCVRITSAAAAATTKGFATTTRGFSVNTFSTEKKCATRQFITLCRPTMGWSDTGVYDRLQDTPPPPPVARYLYRFCTRIISQRLYYYYYAGLQPVPCKFEFF